MKRGVVSINGQQRPMNGEIAMIFKADNLSSSERVFLRSYFNTTRNIAGCQALRKRIGHCLFGFRVVHGECIFVTLSPNRRHSSMILKLSRVRTHDTSLQAEDTCTQAKKRFRGADDPPIFVDGFVTSEADVEKARVTLQLPSIKDRQGMNAQDPLSSVHHYLICAYVLLPGTFGLRMCFNCPHCNVDEHDPHYDGGETTHGLTPCQDMLGRNTKPMGGYAGLAEGMGFATEFQGDGTPHGHGFVCLVNAYQYGSLQDIADLIESNASKYSAEDVLQRLTSFMEHLEREDHFDDELHQASLGALEKDFKRNNDGPAANIFLSARTRSFYENARVPCGWDSHGTVPLDRLRDAVLAEAAHFKKQYLADVQFIFSRVQHHWHPLNNKFEREAPGYCKPKKNVKKTHVCKRGFPKTVLRKKDGSINPQKYRVRIVCRGVAAELKLSCTGRRNMLGSVLGKRRCQWFSSTSGLLAHVFRSNTNLQTNYRIPITAHTHDKDCTRPTCASELCSRKVLILAQRAMKQMTGYFGGYICKKQKMGQFELKRSIDALPLLKEKLQKRNLKTASSQLAHVCNRFFSVLESKGILRAATEEFLLASRYKPGDELAAEFVRTFRHTLFFGVYFLQRYDALKQKQDAATMKVILPKTCAIVAEMDQVALYGLRPQDARLRILSPWQFVQWWKPHRLRIPSRKYPLTKWTDEWDADAGRLPVAGKDFILNETFISSNRHWLMSGGFRLFHGIPAVIKSHV